MAVQVQLARLWIVDPFKVNRSHFFQRPPLFCHRKCCVSSFTEANCFAPQATSQVDFGFDFRGRRVTTAGHVDIQLTIIVKICELATIRLSNARDMLLVDFVACNLFEFATEIFEQKIAVGRNL